MEFFIKNKIKILPQYIFLMFLFKLNSIVIYINGFILFFF